MATVTAFGHHSYKVSQQRQSYHRYMQYMHGLLYTRIYIYIVQDSVTIATAVVSLSKGFLAHIAPVYQL